MKRDLLKPLSLLSIAFVLSLCLPQQAAADEDDPPSRVARLSYVRGSVSFQPAGEEEWVSAVVNRPFTMGDKLWADQGARAELHIGTAAIRLGDDTGFSFLDLNDRVTQIRVTAGTVYVRLRELDADELFEVDTPNLAFSLLRAGEYRIDVNEAGDVTRLTVRGGEGEVTGGGEAFAVHAGQTAEFRGNDQLETAFDTVASRDDFDEWCAERNRREDHARSAQYVSRDVIGYEDLDDYGEWRTEPEYGHVWVPRTVVVGWAPYRYGHWAWIWPWGWTWVDDAPWGFAPFHYGRWVFVGGYWGWVPCPVRVRPVYAPALVAWVGGSNFSIGISVGRGPAVGWFPLGPREVFIPSYRVSRTYVTNINVTNTTVNNVYVTNVYNNYATNRVTNIRYVNRERATVVSQTAFASAQPVARNIVQVDRREIERARVTAAVDVTPQQRALLGAGNPSARKPPERVVTRAVVAKTAPPQPVPFAVQRKAIAANGGRMPDRQEIEQMRPTADEGARPNVRIASPVRSAGERRVPSNARPSPPVTPATRQTAKPVPAMPERPEPMREDRPAEVKREERAAPQPADRPVPKAREERPAGQPADRPARNPKQIEREEQLRQKQQQEQQKLQQRQEQERQRLEQKHQEQEQRARQQAENARQQQEHLRQQQRQEQERQGMEQRHQQQREKVQQREAKQRQKEEKKQEQEKPREERPPGR